MRPLRPDHSPDHGRGAGRCGERLQRLRKAPKLLILLPFSPRRANAVDMRLAETILLV
jgi:hypothetical protein